MEGGRGARAGKGEEVGKRKEKKQVRTNGYAGNGQRDDR